MTEGGKKARQVEVWKGDVEVRKGGRMVVGRRIVVEMDDRRGW